MNHKIYSIYDVKAKTYTLPFFQHRDEMAIRLFSDWVNDPEHQFGRHPEDYTLFSAGTYDEETGTITQDHIGALVTGLQILGTDEK